MKRTGLIVIMVLINIYTGLGQIGTVSDSRIVFHGIVRDASTLQPLPNSQIAVNRSIVSVSDTDGTFYLSVNKKDTVVFTMLGYRPAVLHISDTLPGREFISGVYLRTDTISIDEVIIVPRTTNLKYDLLNTPVATSQEMENARYNIAVSAYQGKVSQGQLGDPVSNYGIIHQQQKINAFEKGGIPSDRIVGLSPFMILPAAYLLLNGLPPKPAPMKSTLTRKEIDQIHQKYLERVRRD